MIEQYLLIRWADGRMGGVLPKDFADPDKAKNFEDARVVSWESGEVYEGPTTPEGMARKAEREVEARREARRERHAAREAERVGEVPVEREAEPVPGARE